MTGGDCVPETRKQASPNRRPTVIRTLHDAQSSGTYAEVP